MAQNVPKKSPRMSLKVKSIFPLSSPKLSVCVYTYSPVRPPTVIQDRGQKPKHHLLAKYTLASQFLVIVT